MFSNSPPLPQSLIDSAAKIFEATGRAKALTFKHQDHDKLLRVIPLAGGKFFNVDTNRHIEQAHMSGYKKIG